MLKSLVRNEIEAGKGMKEATQAAYETIIELAGAKEKPSFPAGSLPSGAATQLTYEQRRQSAAQREAQYRQAIRERSDAVRGITRKRK